VKLAKNGFWVPMRSAGPKPKEILRLSKAGDKERPCTVFEKESTSEKFEEKAKDKTHCLIIYSRSNKEHTQYEGFVQFKEYTTLGEFAEWFRVTIDKDNDMSWLKAEHVDAFAFQKTEDIYDEYDVTTSEYFPVISYKQEDSVSMRYDDSPVFHLDAEWLKELDRSARNKKEIVTLRETLEKTETELADLKAMFHRFLGILPRSMASQMQVNAIVLPSASGTGAASIRTNPNPEGVPFSPIASAPPLALQPDDHNSVAVGSRAAGSQKPSLIKGHARRRLASQPGRRYQQIKDARSRLPDKRNV